MTNTIKHEHLFEQDILNRLKTTGMTKRKVKSTSLKIFLFYPHRIKKYSLTQEEVSDVYTDTILAVLNQ
jgi:hypothetical protein